MVLYGAQVMVVLAIYSTEAVRTSASWMNGRKSSAAAHLGVRCCLMAAGVPSGWQTALKTNLSVALASASPTPTPVMGCRSVLTAQMKMKSTVVSLSFFIISASIWQVHVDEFKVFFLLFN